MAASDKIEYRSYNHTQNGFIIMKQVRTQVAYTYSARLSKDLHLSLPYHPRRKLN